MNWIFNKVYKLRWMARKILGIKRKDSLIKITPEFTPSNNKRIVYSISCHKNAHQVIRLIKSIYREDNLYYLNLDTKSSTEFYRKIKKYSSNYSNIFLTHNQVDWGNWNQVQVVLDIMKNALLIDNSWTHFLNLSGQDFPLKSQEKIKEELERAPNINYIGARHYGPENPHAARIFSFRPSGRKWEKRLRLDITYPEIKFRKGSQWMILTRDFCDFITNGEESKKFQTLFRNAYIPDESFFPTLAGNTEFSNSTNWDNKHYVDWSENECHPAILKIDQLDKLISSSHFFARKFDEEVDEEIIKKLEDNL